MFTVCLLLWHLLSCFCRGAEVSDCGRYVILTPHEGCAPMNRLFYCDLEKQKDGITGNNTLEKSSESAPVPEKQRSKFSSARNYKKYYVHFWLSRL